MTTHTHRPIDIDHWRERLAALAERHGVPGAQLGILRLGTDGDDEVVEVAHGVLNVGTGHAVDTGSVFQIGSITKVWTATVVLGLVDEGLLSLETPVVEVLPEFGLADPEHAARITVRHLLNHTSGIDGDLFTDTGRGDDALERYVERLRDSEPTHPLGATFSYCNSGFPLLGRIIEKLTGRVWDEAMRERLYTPLGLTRAGTLPEEAVLHGAAVGHVVDPTGAVPVPVWGITRSMGPAGLVHANAADVLTFAAAHLRGGRTAGGERVLSSESAEAMTRHSVDLPDPDTLGDSWGLGWIRYGWDGYRLVGHDGNTIGQSAFLRLFPEAGLAVTLLTNGGQARDLYQELYAEVFEEVARVRIRPAPVPAVEPGPVADAEDLPLLGAYRNAVQRLEVRGTGERLVLRVVDLGGLTGIAPEPPKAHPLAPLRENAYLFRPEEQRTWVPVTFYALEPGHEYVHVGGRALPLVEGEGLTR
ncbi:serine hydrolase domain-containing protein [Nocardiopsis sp. NPDC006832]|uniref:serine hydrolase domain-containing protein n=1 Tax=Nocardiopsis sp. NPDC006832 TaxID=3157188 RepID=UPI0034025755